MASMVGGKFGGVNPNADIVPLKVNAGTLDNPTILQVHRGMQTILSRQDSAGSPRTVLLQCTSIKLTELESNRPFGLDTPADTYEFYFQWLAKYNVDTVIPTTNHAELDPPLNELGIWSPQVWANKQLTEGRLIVVGSCDIDGYRAPSSAYLGLENAIDLYAFGRGILVPSEASTSEYRLADGSSVAAATVAGLITMLVASGDLTGNAKAKDLLNSIAISRKGFDWPTQDEGYFIPRIAMPWEMPCSIDQFQFSQPITSYVAIPEPITVAVATQTFADWAATFTVRLALRCFLGLLLQAAQRS